MVYILRYSYVEELLGDALAAGTGEEDPVDSGRVAAMSGDCLGDPGITGWSSSTAMRGDSALLGLVLGAG